MTSPRLLDANGMRSAMRAARDWRSQVDENSGGAGHSSSPWRRMHVHSTQALSGDRPESSLITKRLDNLQPSICSGSPRLFHRSACAPPEMSVRDSSTPSMSGHACLLLAQASVATRVPARVFRTGLLPRPRPTCRAKSRTTPNPRANPVRTMRASAVCAILADSSRSEHADTSRHTRATPHDPTVQSTSVPNSPYTGT